MFKSIVNICSNNQPKDMVKKQSVKLLNKFLKVRATVYIELFDVEQRGIKRVLKYLSHIWFFKIP